MKHPQYNRRRTALACAASLTVLAAQAAPIETDNPDLKLRWDTTVKYSTAFRVKDLNPELVGAAQANLDDGDRNFSKKGLVSNRLDLLTEMDLVYKERWGARLSGAAWYDDVYQRHNDNNSPLTINSGSVPAGEFTRGTRDLMGRKAELLDAFVFGGADIGEMALNGRFGRHAQVWGETLFFGANGIAGGMAPIDYVKLFSIPGAQFKEVIRPINQLSMQLQVRPGLTIGGYYQLQWEANRIPGSGAFTSLSDIYGEGRERMLWPTGAYFSNANEIKPSNHGQYGAQLRIRPEGSDADIGLYAIRYHQKDPNVYVRPTDGSGFFSNQGGPGQRVGDFALVYHEGARAYGASVSTTLGEANVGLEVSLRENAALVNPGTFVFSPAADNLSNPAYPVGRSAHLNASMVQLLSPNALWQGGTFLAELGWNRLLSVSANPLALDPNASRDALGMRAILSPAYYQVFDGVDLNVPIGLGYNPKGKSSVVSLFNGGVHHGGDFSVGLAGQYQKKVNFSLTYTGYFGAAGAVLAPSNDRLSYRQYYKDRNNISASIQTTF